MRDIKRKYEGFSFVEMLLTILLLGIIMLIVATTMNTVIKVSNTSNSKNLARNDMDYIMDIVNRTITNADLGNILLFKSDTVRTLGVDNYGQLRIVQGDTNAIDTAYANGTPSTVLEGNEIQVKLYGYSYWTCIGYFRDNTNPSYGYIVKTTSSNLVNHKECFSYTAVVTLLHSFMVDASNFSVKYVEVGDGTNSMFIVDSTLRPLYWPVSDTFPVKRDVVRQIVISTQALTWY